MYYDIHLFVCENRRDGAGSRSCGVSADAFSQSAVRYLRGLLREHGVYEKTRIRINRAGCFNRCEEGPVLVIYPEGAWYTYRSEADLAEIIHSHIINNAPVPRLALPAQK